MSGLIVRISPPKGAVAGLGGVHPRGNCTLADRTRRLYTRGRVLPEMSHFAKG